MPDCPSLPDPSLGTCTNLIGSKGTKLYIADPCQPLPDTFDAEGYDALTWIEIGMIESIGEVGPQTTNHKFTPLGTGIACKYLGETDNGDINVTCARVHDDSDTGQMQLKLRQGNNNPIAFKIELSHAGIDDEVLMQAAIDSVANNDENIPDTLLDDKTYRNATHARMMFSGLIGGYRLQIGSVTDVVKFNTTISITGSIIEAKPVDGHLIDLNGNTVDIDGNIIP
jgi:hypothetical protein